MSNPNLYTIGGTVQAGSGAYVARSVDADLLDLCRRREFSFVLTARQMGKSSLMVRTAQSLAKESIRSVIVDLSQIGVRLSPEAWYLGIITTLEDALDLDTDIYEWWERHAQLGHAQRFTRFLQDIVLEEIEEPIVVFMDEIDTTLSLEFTDDFFAAIRYVHNARSQVPVFQRLSFVLIGVATPSDLIGDATRTPFNIGHRVDVGYFTREEAMPLAAGLDDDAARAREALGWVFDWTSGHPYLTQRLCYALADQEEHLITRAIVDQTVTETFLGERADQDNNIRFVNDMLTMRAEDPLAVLGAYRDIVKGRTVRDDAQSPTVTHLKLSGVVAPSAGQLVLRNRIYASVFDRAWIRDRWPEHWIRSIPRPVLGLVAASFFAIIFLGLAFTATRERAAQTRFNAELSAINDSLVVAKAESDSLRVLTEDSNTQLSGALGVSDSLRALETTANRDLQTQIAVSEDLRQQTDQINSQLTTQIETSDQLRSRAEAANDSLVAAEATSDLLRQLAERNLDDATTARRETLVLGLATTALRQVRQGDPTLAALLARQALEMAESGAAEYLDPVHDALTQALNQISDNRPQIPIVDAGFDSGVRTVVYGPDGSVLVGTESGKVVLKTAGGSVELAGHDGPVRSLAFAPDGSQVVSAGYDGRVLIQSTSGEGRPRELAVHPGGAWSVTFSPDGTRVASVGADGVVRYRARDGSVKENRTPGEGGRLTGIVFSPDGNSLVVSGENGMLWRSIVSDGRPGGLQGWRSGQGRVNSVVFSPDGRILASGGSDGRVLFWDTSDWSEARAVKAQVGPINAIAFSPDGSRFASGSSDHSIAVWTDGFNQNPIILQGHDQWVMSVAFSPDGQSLVSGSVDRTTRTWVVETRVLADRVCGATQRVLTPFEWAQFVGEDFDYATELALCRTLGER
jgi:WD40 repeat protein